MYTKESQEHQYSFTHDWFVVPDLDTEHELVKITKSMDWVSLSQRLCKFYSAHTGRPTKPSRAKVGLLILKHLYGFSDREVIDLLKRDIYAQYLCDVSLKEAKDFLNPSTLTKFRKQIGIEGIKIIEQEAIVSIQRAKLFKGRKLVVDTTVVPANIAYPTDVSLLEKTRRKTLKYLDTAKQFGSKIYRTYKRIARKTFIQFQKVGHHTIRARRKVQKKLIQFTDRNIKQLKSAMESIAKSASAKSCNVQEKFIREVKDFIDIASKIISQQKDVYKNIPVKERIVSVFHPHIRPIVRGKYPVEVEFGPKVLLSLKNDFLFLDDLRFNNIADSDIQLLDTSLKNYNERFCKLPTQVATDRGFWSPDNYRLCENYGISKIAIEPKGKNTNLATKPFRHRLRRLRCKIESKISLAKRKFGLDRIRYTMDSGEEMWIRLGLIAMNLKTAVRYG